MDNVKALEILKESAKSTRLVHEYLLGDNVPPSMKNSLEAIEVAIGAVGKQIPEPVRVRRRDGYLRPDYYCPVCNKQQKDSFKNRREGCYCERCGQRLTF